MLDDASDTTPLVFDYGRQAACNGRVNTPPTFSIYIAGPMFDWMIGNGGLETFALAG